MTQRDPSYLLNRNGIYYFHYRIPKHLKHRYGAKDFIRKSLKTTNRYEALNKARLTWSEVMSKSTQDKIDADAQRQPTARAKSDEVMKLHESGLGASAIARDVGISRSSVYRIVK